MIRNSKSLGNAELCAVFSNDFISKLSTVVTQKNPRSRVLTDELCDDSVRNSTRRFFLYGRKNDVARNMSTITTMYLFP